MDVREENSYFDISLRDESFLLKVSSMLCFLVHRPWKGRYKIRPKCAHPRKQTFLVFTGNGPCCGGCSCLFFRRHLLLHQTEVREHVFSRATDAGSVQQWTASCVSEASRLKNAFWFWNTERPWKKMTLFRTCIGLKKDTLGEHL